MSILPALPQRAKTHLSRARRQRAKDRVVLLSYGEALSKATTMLEEIFTSRAGCGKTIPAQQENIPAGC
jgi:hypothetical protein